MTPMFTTHAISHECDPYVRSCLDFFRYAHACRNPELVEKIAASVEELYFGGWLGLLVDYDETAGIGTAMTNSHGTPVFVFLGKPLPQLWRDVFKHVPLSPLDPKKLRSHDTLTGLRLDLDQWLWSVVDVAALPKGATGKMVVS
jgi:hypothetical protein